MTTKISRLIEEYGLKYFAESCSVCPHYDGIFGDDSCFECVNEYSREETEDGERNEK